MATYFFGQSPKDSKWYFRLKANNHEIILAGSEGYNSKQGCLKGVDSVKEHSASDEYYETFKGSDGKHYFTLNASNGEAIGKSEGYNSSQGRDVGKENCKTDAPQAELAEVQGADL